MFSDRLKALRKKSGMSQSALANALFVSQQAVARWETDKATPNPETLSKLVELFQVSADELLGTENIKKPLTSEDVSGLTEKQIKILEMMGELPEQDQDDLIQSERIWSVICASACSNRDFIRSCLSVILTRLSKIRTSVCIFNNTLYLDIWQGQFQDIVNFHKILVFNLDTCIKGRALWDCVFVKALRSRQVCA